MKLMIARAAAALPLVAAGTIATTPVAAASDLAVGAELGKTEAEIRATLEAAGYTVEEIETEDGEIEAEVVKNDRSMEIEVDTETGLIAEVELDDDDGEDEDDEDEDDGA